MKFITSTDLNLWASTTDCQCMLPELVKRLIEVSALTLNKCRIPSGDAVHMPGWDGIVNSNDKIYTVEAGVSLWEMGCDKDVTSKINSDFGKRTNDPLGYSLDQSTFVFVTPRLWVKAESWIKHNMEVTSWKNIVVLTAIELEDWINQNPIVGLWLAKHLNIISDDSLELVDNYWDNWATGQKLKLLPNLLLGGRDNVTSLVKNAISQHELLCISAVTREEAKAYVVAVIKTIAKEIPSILDRCIIVSNVGVLQKMLSHFKNLIIIYNGSDICYNFTQNQNTIICAISPVDYVNNAVPLPQIDRELFVKSLEDSGLTGDIARKLAVETSRNVSILRRRQEIEMRPPLWMQDEKRNEFIGLLLAGQWNTNCAGDREALSGLVNLSWEQTERICMDLLHSEDSPLMKKDVIWRVASPYEVVIYLNNTLVDNDLQTFKSVFLKVMSDDDEDVLSEINSKSLAFFRHETKYSHTLKKGLCRSLIMLAIQNVERQQWVDCIVEELFKTYDLKRYLSNRNSFVLLAEASPTSTLRFINVLLGEKRSILDELFKIREKEFGLGTNSYYTDLLFVLEELAWDKNFLLQVSEILIQLMDYKEPSNVGNKPRLSLRAIMRYQLPQTFASNKERKQVIETIVKKYPKHAFVVCMDILTQV